MLKANNLAVAVPTGPCLKGCPYCVSEMTWRPRQDETRFAGNMGKARGAAMAAGISSVMITAKGEPLGYPESVAFVKSVARAFPDIPVELQTNGLRLVGDPGLAESLAESGVNVIAVSMDDGKTMDHPGFALAVENAARHLVVRATLVMTNRMGPYACPSAALDKVAGMGGQTGRLRHPVRAGGMRRHRTGRGDMGSRCRQGRIRKGVPHPSGRRMTGP